MSAAEKLAPQIQIKLVIRKGPHAGQSFSFAKTLICIGRNPENDIVLLNDPKISRQHANIQVSGQDVEIINLSQKNTILVNGENIQRWKLVNDSIFIVGDCEFQISFDLGQSVVPVKAQAPAVQSVAEAQNAAVNSILASVASSGNSVPARIPGGGGVKVAPPVQTPKHNMSLVKAQNSVAVPQSGVPSQINHQLQPQTTGQMQGFNPGMNQFDPQFAGAARAAPRAVEPQGLAHPRTRFYMIVGIALIGFAYFIMSPEKKGPTGPRKSTLKYEDEAAIKEATTNQKNLKERLDELKKQKDSPTVQRAEENFIKGMRDFQLGNYTRAQDFFQVVLNLQPDHALAKRHLYLAKERFNEVLKAKLILGESYYQKHNFRMCEDMYQQVKDMLEGKSNDQNYLLAQSMADRCKLAAEGVR